MVTLDQLKTRATAGFLRNEWLPALRDCAAILEVAPTDVEVRLKAADCLLKLGHTSAASQAYRAVATYALKAGHPLTAFLCARVLHETLAEDADDIITRLVAFYGCESPLLAATGARVSLPSPQTAIEPPTKLQISTDDAVRAIAKLVATCTDDFTSYPDTLHPIPLLSQLSEAAFRKVVDTFIVHRLPHDTTVIRQGDPGDSFFLVATGAVSVVRADHSSGTKRELARLHEGSVFGEMAVINAEPRTASVVVVREADIIEVTRSSLAVLAGELEQLATAMHNFTQERLLRNLLASQPFFQPFDASQRHDMLARFTHHDVATGTQIIAQDDDGTGLFIVVSGEVEVFRTTGGETIPLANLRGGDVFGEISMIRGGKTTAFVVAAKPCHLLFLAREYVERLIAGIPAIRDYLTALADSRELEIKMATD